MKNFLFLLLISLCLSLSIKAQDAEKDVVKRVVETYLFSEENTERKQTLYEQAKIFSVNPDGSKIVETIFAKKQKTPKGMRVISLQKVVNIDIFENAANVKVETDLSSGEAKFPKHYQFISLLKANGEWKIVSVLMPTAHRSQ